MLKLILTFFINIKGLVSEATRGILVRKFCNLLATSLRDSAQWLEVDQARFIDATGIDKAIPRVPDISTENLNSWADKWLHVDAFREKGGEEWTAITPTMNSLRVTMIADLKNMQQVKIVDAQEVT